MTPQREKKLWQGAERWGSYRSSMALSTTIITATAGHADCSSVPMMAPPIEILMRYRCTAAVLAMAYEASPRCFTLRISS